MFKLCDDYDRLRGDGVADRGRRRYSMMFDEFD